MFESQAMTFQLYILGQLVFLSFAWFSHLENEQLASNLALRQCLVENGLTKLKAMGFGCLWVLKEGYAWTMGHLSWISVQARHFPLFEQGLLLGHPGTWGGLCGPLWGPQLTHHLARPVKMYQ